MPKGIPLTSEEQAARQREIVDIAIRIFRDKGFQRTSMREIAEAAEMGKSSLYDFFKTKDEIVVFALEEEMTEIIGKTREIVCLELPPNLILKRVMETNLSFMKTNNNLLLWLGAETQFLDSAYQKRLKDKHYAYQDMVKSVIEDAISKGLFRDVNALLAARLLINSMLAIVVTTRPTGTVEEMLDEAVEIFLSGIKT